MNRKEKIKAPAKTPFIALIYNCWISNKDKTLENPNRMRLLGILEYFRSHKAAQKSNKNKRLYIIPTTLLLN